MKCYDMNDEKIMEILKIVECSKETIELYVQYDNEHKHCDQIQLLKHHRCLLLNQLHLEQKKIDCLDYLLYFMKNQCQ